MCRPNYRLECLLFLAFTCNGLTFISHAAATNIEPYAARVTAARALVMSGPDEKFYPTGTLSPGDRVEVYREAAGGWLGIRPPKGSFSLVSEKELSARNGDLAEVRVDDVSSRIGSQLSDKCNAVQVRLKKGEVVEILGQASVVGETWIKIAPPAGEFRWIHAGSVERSGPVSQSGTPDEAAANAVATAATAESELKQSDGGSKGVDSPTPAAASEESWKASSSPAAIPAPGTTPPAVESAPEVVPPPLVSPAAPVTAGATPTNMPAAVPPKSSATAPATSVTPVESDLSRRLTDIELRLSRMASASPQLWNTERLQRDAEQLLAQAESQADRDAVKVTMGKIDQFTSLTRRYQQGNQAVSRQPSAVSQNLVAGRSPSVVGQPDGRYDAVGILRPVVSKRPGAPQFALVDERGQVVTFVTPSPDVNLQPYLGRRVGIAGNRGFIPEFNRSHVTAGRVTPLMR